MALGLPRFEEGGLRCVGAAAGCAGAPATICHGRSAGRPFFSGAIGRDAKFDDNCFLNGGESSSLWNLRHTQPTDQADWAVTAFKTDRGSRAMTAIW
jgi:hypothetical protein